MKTAPPQRYIETFASISFATTISIVIHQISRYPHIFGDPTSPFRVASVAVLAVGFVLLFWASIVKFCPRTARCLRLDRLKVYDYHGDINRVISMFLPLGITFILSSWMTTSDYNTAIANTHGGVVLKDSYALALWISAGLTILFFLALMRNARKQRLEVSRKRLDPNSASLSGVQDIAEG